MKNTFLSFAILIIASLSANAQLRPTLRCPNFEVDVLAGTVNDLLPKSAVSEIQATLPCFTATIIKDSATTCAGVFYKDRDINFYTDRRYIEIGEKFKLTRERVRQIKDKAINKLRSTSKSKLLKNYLGT